MKIEDVTRKLKEIPSIQKKVRRLEVALHLSLDRVEKAEIEQVLLALYHRHYDLSSDNPFSFAGKELENGELCLGEAVLPNGGRQAVRLAFGELRQHLSVFGRAGAGKTNFVYQLLRELYRKRMPFLLTDWKNDYADLDWAQLLRGIGDSEGPDIHVLSVGRVECPGLQLNPLIPPPGVEPRTWLKRICEVFTHAYMGGPRFEQIIRDACDHLYREHGVYEGNPESYPTIAEVKQYLERFKPTGREAQWMQSVMSTLSSLCFGGTGETLNVPTQPPLDFLIRECVVLDMSALSNADKTLIVETLLLWIYHYRLSQPLAKELQSVILLEEAHHLLREKHEDEESIMDVTLREIRSLGIGVVVIDQMPCLLSKVALANTFATIALNLKLSDDKEKLARCMNLNPEQKEALGHLPIGTAVVKLQDRHTRPFVMEIPLVPAPRLPRHSIPVSRFAHRQFFTQGLENASDFTGRRHVSAPSENASERAPPPPSASQQESRKATHLPVSGLTHSKSPISATPDRISPKEFEINGKTAAENDHALTLEIALLTDIARMPISTITDRYKRLDVSPRKGNTIKKQLVDAGWIGERIIHGRNNWVKLLKPTPQGEEQLKKAGIAYATNFRHGGLEHKYWTQTIADHCCDVLGTEYEVLEEYPIGQGKTADVVVIKDGRVLAVIEVETGKSNIQQNISKYENLGLRKVIIAFTNKNLLEKELEKQIIPPSTQLTTTSQVIMMNKDIIQ